MLDPKPGVKTKAINMILPIATMVGLMPLMLSYTGWNEVENSTQMNFLTHSLKAIGHGSGSSAVLYSVICSLLVGVILYRSQGIMKTRELVDLALKGIGGLMPLALLMLLAFAIGNVCKELDTGGYVASVTRGWLSPGLVPAIIFMVSAFIAFATGTSWGTFAIMMSIAVPMSQSLDANLYMAVAAVLGGGVFGDHCSPISDTTILSSMASASDHIDHVKTQLPYALSMGAIAVFLYLLLGLIF